MCTEAFPGESCREGALGSPEDTGGGGSCALSRGTGSQMQAWTATANAWRALCASPGLKGALHEQDSVCKRTKGLGRATGQGLRALQVLIHTESGAALVGRW